MPLEPSRCYREEPGGYRQSKDAVKDVAVLEYDAGLGMLSLAITVLQVPLGGDSHRGCDV